MVQYTIEQLRFSYRLGKEIAVNELSAAHAALDRCSVPRRLRGKSLDLPARILYLHIRLSESRIAVRQKQIFVLAGEERIPFIIQAYQKNGGKL